MHEIDRAMFKLALANPDTVNPTAEDGNGCVYTDPTQPWRHCLAGTYFLTLPLPKATIQHTLDANEDRPASTVARKLGVHAGDRRIDAWQSLADGNWWSWDGPEGTQSLGYNEDADGHKQPRKWGDVANIMLRYLNDTDGL